MCQAMALVDDILVSELLCSKPSGLPVEFKVSILPCKALPGLGPVRRCHLFPYARKLL